MLSIALMTTVLLISCVKENSRPAPINVQPLLDEYSSSFQSQLAVEMEAETRLLCARDILAPDCSAWKRAINDYLHLRNGIRAAAK